jgi:hypothetical protein
MRSFDRRDAAPSRLILAAIAGTSSLAIACLLLAGAGSLAKADQPGLAQYQRQRAAVGQTPDSGHDLVGRLATKGFVVTDPVIRRGQAYLTHGTDKHGRRVRLVVDSRSSEIIGLRVVEGLRPGRERTAAPP